MNARPRTARDMPDCRHFDGYISSDLPLDLGQVIFIGVNRAVVRKRFDSKWKWDADRNLGPRATAAESRGGVLLADQRFRGALTSPNAPREMPQSDGSTGPPADHLYFYGVNYL